MGGEHPQRLAYRRAIADELANGAQIGAALAAYGPRLLPYLVHLPLEWLGLACGAATWLVARGRAPTRTTLTALAAAATLAMVAAALLEVYGTPATG